MRRDAPSRLHTERARAVEAQTTTAATPGPAAFAIRSRELDRGTTALIVQGELDLATAPQLKWALTDVIDAGVGQIVLDLSPVTFIDSTALGVLVGARRSLASGSRLAIVCANADVLRIFELTGLDATFSIFSTLDHALSYLRGSAAAAG